MIIQLAFDPAGVVVATAAASSLVELWDASNGRSFARLTGHTGMATTVAFAPDGQLLASGSSDNTIKIWDSRSRNLVRTLEGHTDVVRSISFLADGRLLASQGARRFDTAVGLCDLGPGRSDSRGGRGQSGRKSCIPPDPAAAGRGGARERKRMSSSSGTSTSIVSSPNPGR